MKTSERSIAGSGPIRDRNAFTLVEILVAIGLASVVAAAAVAIYQSLAITTGSIRRQQGRRVEAAVAAARIARDIECAIPVPMGDGAPMSLVAAPLGDTECSSLLLHAAAEKRDASGSTWTADRVQYQVEQDPTNPAAGIVLVRLAGEAAMVDAVTTREEIMRGIDRFDISVCDGTNWHSSWPVEGSSPLPIEARITIGWKDRDLTEEMNVVAVIRSGRIFQPPAAQETAKGPPRASRIQALDRAFGGRRRQAP